MSQETKTCAGCGAKVIVDYPYQFKERHSCPKRGVRTGKLCPKCSSPLVYRLGKYQVFQGCSAWETTRCDGKIGAPRGQYSKQAQEDKSEETEAEIVQMAGENEAGKALWSLIKGSLNGEFDALVKQSVEKALLTQGGTSITIEIKKDDLKLGEVKGAHKLCAKILNKIKAGKRNFLLVGPAGSGKTTLAKHVAEALGLQFAHVSCSAGMGESALYGRAIPNLTTGAVQWQAAEYVNLYEQGGVFLLDELDSADSNVMIAINSSLANGHMAVPNRTENPKASRHGMSIVIAAANTYGTGADRVYVGRNQLDGATLDRFVGCTFDCDYDRDLEKGLIGGLDNGMDILKRGWAIREKIASLKLRRIWSTRAMISIAQDVNAGGLSVDEAFKDCLTGWTQDELSKIGEAK